jgi:hypothetical protein
LESAVGNSVKIADEIGMVYSLEHSGNLDCRVFSSVEHFESSAEDLAANADKDTICPKERRLPGTRESYADRDERRFGRT